MHMVKLIYCRQPHSEMSLRHSSEVNALPLEKVTQKEFKGFLCVNLSNLKDVLC